MGGWVGVREAGGCRCWGGGEGVAGRILQICPQGEKIRKKGEEKMGRHQGVCGTGLYRSDSRSSCHSSPR